MTGKILIASPWARENTPLLISLWGLSGCGKTLSALLLARGLAGPKGKVGAIDSERRRMKVHAGRSEIGDVIYRELTPPFTPERYVDALEEMYSFGLDALILDSASHEWDAEGGVIDLADNNKTATGSDAKGLNKWRVPKSRHKKFMQTLLRHPMHLIVCFRAKRKFVQKKGSDQIEEKGLVPIQEFGFIYETTAQLYLPVPEVGDDGRRRGVPRVERCPDDLLPFLGDGKQIAINTGADIREWAAGGVKVDQALVALTNAARDAAGQGTEVYRRHWESLTEGQRKKLAGEHANLKSIAASADAEKRRAEEAARAGSGTSAPAAANDWPAYQGRIIAELTAAAEHGADLVTKVMQRELGNLMDAPQSVADAIKAHADTLKRKAKK